MAGRRTIRHQIDLILSEYEGVTQKAFLESIADIKSRVVLTDLIDKLEAGDIEGAINRLNLERAAFTKVESAISQAYEAGGMAMVNHLPTLRDASGAKAVIRFDVRNLRAETWLRDHSSNLVTNIIENQRTSIRSALQSGLSQGRNPRSVALDILGRVNRATGSRTGGLIGLTGKQSEYVASARSELSSGDAQALRNYLTRTRRDKRFDRTVLKAIREGKSIDVATIDKMVGRYSDSLLKLRGETLARSEMLQSLNAGKHEGFVQGLEKTNYPPEAVTKVWRSAGDGRVRHTHAIMSGQEAKGLDGAFQSPSGAQLRFPGDTSLGAGPEETINCRCNVDYRIDFSHGLE